MSPLYNASKRMFLVSILALCCIFVQAQLRPGSVQSVTPGKIMLKLNPSATVSLQRNIAKLSTNTRAETFSTGIFHLDAVAHKFKAINMVRVFPNAGRMEAKQRRYGLDRWYVLQIDQAIDIPTAINEFRQVHEIETVQPSYTIKAITGPITKITSGTPIKPLGGITAPVNDPLYHYQWHYHNTAQVGGYSGADINLEPAWKINAGTPNVIVDVVDEGVDYKHEDLAANMWVNQAELYGLPGVDDDGNGYVDDIYGYNFADQSSVISPGDHGTHTSGTIAAVNNNGIGLCGIAGGTGNGDGARIMSSEIFGAVNGADGAGTAAAIVYGANNGAVISQNSWGYTIPNVYDQVVLDAIDYFTKEAGRDVNGIQVGPMNGGVVIFAAGNNNISDPSYPAFYPTCIAVGATTVYDNKASYSNFGSWLDISAPGGDVTDPTSSRQEVASTVANNGYGYMAGTSMATPHVSGVAALIVSQFGKPGFTNQDLKNRLFNSVSPFIAMDPSYNGLMGAGRLDAGKALQADNGIPPVAISDLKGKSSTQNSIDLSWTAPADPDNGNASSYIVYYATHAFDNTQKDSLPKIFINKASTAGSAETYTVSGLLPSTDYFISVSAKDLWGNQSSLSNFIKTTTLPGPIVIVPQDSLRLKINVVANPIQSTSLKLSNNGPGPLVWTGNPLPVSSSWARQDGFDTLSQFSQSYPDAFVGDDQRKDFSAATRFDITGKAFNLTHVASYMQTAGVVAPITIYVYKGGDDPSKGILLIKQQLAQANDYSLNITKLNGMFLFQPGDWFWIVYQYDPAYGFGQGAVRNAGAALEHYNLTSSNKGLTWNTITSQYAAVNFFMYGLSNEGYPGGFISILPGSGTLAGLNSSNISVSGNASTIRNGVYNFNIQVSSNDLNNPLVGTPMVVTVSGQKGTLTSKISILDCKDVFIGKEGDVAIMLYNSGLSTLSKFSFSSDNKLFSSVSLPDSLNPGDSARFVIRFVPTTAGQQLAKIKLLTNDGSLNLAASGVGVKPPVLKLGGIPLQIIAKADSTGKNTFTISNKTGKYPLSYSMPEIAAINKARAIQKLTKGTDPTLDYAWIDSREPDGPVYYWDDITQTGTDITAQLITDPKTSKQFPLGFPMKYYGDTITQIYVNGFGALTLNYPGAMNSISTDLPNVGDGISGEIAALFWETMNPTISPTEHVMVKYEPGKFIVQYNELEFFNGNFFDVGSFSWGKCTFQIILYSNGRIEMKYKTVNNTWAQVLAQIGLENKAETKGISVNAPDVQPVPFVPADAVTLWFVPAAPKFITAISPLSGVVNIGDSVKISVTASAAGLVDSSYQSSIALTSNDPLQEQVDVPVTLTVTGIKGMMQKTDTLAFGTLFKNASSKLDAIFLNTGTKPVMLLKTAISNPAYTTDISDSLLVPAFSELHIPVTFSPTTEAAYPALMTVTTNDSARAVFKVILSGGGKATPGITYSLTGGNTHSLNMGQTLPASLQVTNNGDADLKIMVERPQWLVMNQPITGISNGLDSAHTYSVHKNIDSSGASYNWIELANGLGTSTVVDFYSIATQQIKLPFAFPYYGKTYNSLYTDWLGDVLLKPLAQAQTIFPIIPSPTEPNGIISTANIALFRPYDWSIPGYVGQIYYFTDTSKLVVEYYQMAEGNFGDVGNVTFETIFYKDGRIKMLYKSGATTTNFTQNFLVGVENEDGTDGTMAYNRSLWYKDRGVVEFVPSIPYTLKAGKSVTLPASWTTTSMTDGVYKDNLVLSTNDPLHSSIQIPLQLEVQGAASLKTSDSITFGKVVAYNSPTDGQKSYTQPVLIKNNGTKTILISGIDFNGNTSLALNELIQNPDLFTSPVILAPGDELIGHVIFTPDSTMSTLKETMNISSDYSASLHIPITATIVLPPVVTTDTSVVQIELEQTDSATKNVKLGNIGKGGLDYTLSVQYRRPGISYNSTAKAKPLSGKSKKPVAVLFGNGMASTVMGNSITTLGNQPNFADSVLDFDPSNKLITYIGSADDANPIQTASRFNGGKKGLYLSHVGNLYRTDNMNPPTVKFRIRLGSDVNASTIVYEQSLTVQPDTTGTGIYLIAKLDSAILINAYEDFWIEWDFAPTMRFPQGIQFVTTDVQKSQTFYTRISDAGTFSEPPFIANFMTAAYAQKDSTGGWLTITPDSGSVDIGKKQRLTLTAHGPKVPPPDQAADLIVHSNDPVTPITKVAVFVHIDQAPVLSNHDTLTVHEADTLNSLIPATDDNKGMVTIKLISKDKAASVNNTVTGSYFLYKPGYEDAGIHNFIISLSDSKGNKRIDSLTVVVLNTNRPPVVIKHMADRTISLTGPALNLPLDKVFMDPDGDVLQYSFAGEPNPFAKVFIDPSGVISVIPMDTGRIKLVFMANDNNGGICYDTLHLYIRNNTAPVATTIPDVIIDKGSSRSLDLSNYFSDADGDVLTYTASLDSVGSASLDVNGSDLTINGIKPGISLVTVVANDGAGGKVDKSFILFVLDSKGAEDDTYHIRVTPNPVHAFANIFFRLDSEKKVKIELIGVNGVLRAIIFNGNRSAGYQYIPYNFSHLQTGSYTLKFTINDDVKAVQVIKL
jgi:subtilisin family serine protease